ncbi:MAG: sodium/proton-translocating pyrophosphatase, partial [Burkholderiales bacterium]
MTAMQFPLYSIVAGIAGLAAAALVYAAIRRQPEGSAVMRDIAALIRAGAMAFLRREYSVLVPFIAVVALLLGAVIGWRTA